MTIFNELIYEVSNGKSFYADFEKRNLKVDGNYLVKDNVPYDSTVNLLDISEEDSNIDNIIKTIEILYKRYKYSIPTERSDSKRRKYFKALPIDEIPDEYLMVAEDRDLMQAYLEGFILCMLIADKLAWHDEWGNFFWQSNNDEDLVLLKKWF